MTDTIEMENRIAELERRLTELENSYLPVRSFIAGIVKEILNEDPKP